jgi:hypothetical protein
MTAVARPIAYTPELPAPPFRWTPLRKLALVQAVRRAPARRRELIAAYAAAEDEVAGWERRWDIHGLVGLKVTQLQTLPREARA